MGIWSNTQEIFILILGLFCANKLNILMEQIIL